MPKIIRFHETGSADVLKIEDLPLTEPGDGEVRLKVEAISLNRAELMFRRGQYLEDPKLPSRHPRPRAPFAFRFLIKGERNCIHLGTKLTANKVPIASESSEC